jgi:glycosyltransferase involved in cell wall biosynthesis
MQIVHIGPASDVPVLHRFGGAVERRIWEMARRQARRGHRVVVYSADRRTSTRSVDGVELRFIRCRTPHPPRQLEFLARALLDLAWRDRHVDVVHFHGNPEGSALARKLAHLTAISFDYHIYRGGRGMPWGPVYRGLLERFDLLMPCSEYCREQASQYWDIDAGRMAVLFNGVSLEQFAPDRAAGERERRALGLDGPVLLYVGRVCEQKGSHVLVEGYRRLRARGTKARLVVAGPIGQFGGADDGAWSRRIAEVGGVYLGPVEEERLAALYNMATLLVMPTVRFEMFGMAAVEAQACGTPVVASDHGGLRETVPDGCGVRFETGSPEDLARKVEEIVTDDARLDGLRANALRNASRFTWESVCDRFEELVLGRSGRVARPVVARPA